MFSRGRIRLIALAYELTWRDVIYDARVAWTWQSPMDDLVSWLSERHDWSAETSVLYLADLERIRRPRDGGSVTPPNP